MRSDESNGFPFLWGATGMWKSLSERTDILYVPGSHLEMRDEIRGKICGSMMMTTAVLKYESTFSNLQVVRSRSQQRLVESMKRGVVISILSSASKRTMLPSFMIIKAWFNFHILNLHDASELKDKTPLRQVRKHDKRASQLGLEAVKIYVSITCMK